jgi:hypothetical protein
MPEVQLVSDEKQVHVVSNASATGLVVIVDENGILIPEQKTVLARWRDKMLGFKEQEMRLHLEELNRRWHANKR